MQGFVNSVCPASLRATSRSTQLCLRQLRLRCRRNRVSRLGRIQCCAAAPLSSAIGAIEVVGGTSEIAVGDVLRIEYTPAPGTALAQSGESGRVLLWTGGFNGWTGDDERQQTLTFPFTPLLNGSYRVSVTVPDYASSVDFAVTDDTGYVWDDNCGARYVIPVKYRKKLDRDGKITEYTAPDGVEVYRDLSAEVTGPAVLKPEDEFRLHRIRGEAALVGEEKGLGNIMISQARDTFDQFDYDRRGIINREDVGKALEKLGFDVDETELDDILHKYVHDSEECSMVEWMTIYSDLELSDRGLDMV